MIYLDSAATTFQKPPAVRAAVQQALLNLSQLLFHDNDTELS